MREQLERLLSGGHLAEDEAAATLVALTDGALEPALGGALLAALRAKGETATELRGFARAMRELALRPAVPPGTPVADVVGTGGDGSGSLNLSTGAALLAAASGVRIVKHGNRSVSSRSGSADVLEALGYRLPAGPDAATADLSRTGFTFLFAPFFHPAMKAIAPIRRALGVRTVFNLLGPLTNPARPAFHVLGAYSEAAALMMAESLAGLEGRRAFVIHGAAGWDEPTPVGPFLLLDVTAGRIERRREDPADYGLARCSTDDLRGGDAAHNAARLREALAGAPGPHRDALVLGAALALRVTGLEGEPRAAAARAARAIDEGAATRLLDALAASPARDTGGE